MNAVDLPLWAVAPASLLLVSGGLVSLIGALGLLRLDDFYARVHAPTLTNTLGTGCVLLASTLMASAMAGHLVIHELLIAVFILFASPVTTIILMRAARSRKKPEQATGQGKA